MAKTFHTAHEPTRTLRNQHRSSPGGSTKDRSKALTNKVDVKINHFGGKSAGQQDSIGKQRTRKVMLFGFDTCQPHIKTCKAGRKILVNLDDRVAPGTVAVGGALRPFLCSKPDVKLSPHPAFQLGSTTPQRAASG